MKEDIVKVINKKKLPMKKFFIPFLGFILAVNNLSAMNQKTKENLQRVFKKTRQLKQNTEDLHPESGKMLSFYEATIQHNKAEDFSTTLNNSVEFFYNHYSDMVMVSLGYIIKKISIFNLHKNSINENFTKLKDIFFQYDSIDEKKIIFNLLNKYLQSISFPHDATDERFGQTNIELKHQTNHFLDTEHQNFFDEKNIAFSQKEKDIFWSSLKSYILSIKALFASIEILNCGTVQGSKVIGLDARNSYSNIVHIVSDSFPYPNGDYCEFLKSLYFLHDNDQNQDSDLHIKNLMIKCSDDIEMSYKDFLSTIDFHNVRKNMMGGFMNFLENIKSETTKYLALPTDFFCENTEQTIENFHKAFMIPLEDYSKDTGPIIKAFMEHFVNSTVEPSINFNDPKNYKDFISDFLFYFSHSKEIKLPIQKLETLMFDLQ